MSQGRNAEGTSDPIWVVQECSSSWPRVTWVTVTGAFFLSRAEAEAWGHRNARNLSERGWRTYCASLARGSSLADLLRVHAPLDEPAFHPSPAREVQP